MTAQVVAPPPVTTPVVIGSSTPPSLIEVRTTSSQTLKVQGQDEADFYTEQQVKYLSEHRFTAVTDLQDLDRMLFFELLAYRATRQLASGMSVQGHILSGSEEADLRRQNKDLAPLISNLKNDLGITKSQRDKEQFESVGSYLVNLRARAKETGVRREEQLGKALALINQLFAVVGAYDRSDESEREKLGLSNPDDVLDWVRGVMRPEFDAIDEYFRTHAQRFWVRQL